MLNSDYIYQQLPVDIRSFFKIMMQSIPKQHSDLLDNIAIAINTISRFVYLNKAVNVIVATNPFEVTLSNATLSVSLSQTVKQICIENFVFLDLNEMLPLSPSIQRACHLEELAHSLMNVKDEHLVSVIVAEMLPDVQWVNGKYVDSH